MCSIVLYCAAIYQESTVYDVNVMGHGQMGRGWSVRKGIILVILKNFFPDYIFKVKSMKFDMEVLLGGLLDINFCSCQNLEIWDLNQFLHVLVWIVQACVMNGVNVITENTQDGLLSNLEHSLAVIMAQVDKMYKVVGQRSRPKIDCPHYWPFVRGIHQSPVGTNSQ